MGLGPLGPPPPSPFSCCFALTAFWDPLLSRFARRFIFVLCASFRFLSIYLPVLWFSLHPGALLRSGVIGKENLLAGPALFRQFTWFLLVQFMPLLLCFGFKTLENFQLEICTTACLPVWKSVLQDYPSIFRFLSEGVMSGSFLSLFMVLLKAVATVVENSQA